MNIKRNFIITAALYDFIFAYAIYNAYFSFKSISIENISILLGLWAFFALILEIPSGAIADHFNYRKIIILAPIVKSITFIIWYFAGGSIFLYGLGFFFWALGSTLRSGTMEAYLYEAIGKDDFEKTLGMSKYFRMLAISLSLIIGGFLAAIQLELPILFSVLPLWLASYFASKLPDIQVNTEVSHYFDHIKHAFNTFRHNKILRILLMYSLLVSSLADLEEFDQLLYVFLELPVWSFGVISFVTYLGSAFALSIAHRFKYRTYVFGLFTALAALALIILYYSSPLVSLLCLVLSYIITTPLSVLIDGKIQNSIDHQSRATVTSLKGLFINLLGVIIMPVYGYISHIFNLKSIYPFTAILLVLATLLYLKFQNSFTN